MKIKRFALQCFVLVTCCIPSSTLAQIGLRFPYQGPAIVSPFEPADPEPRISWVDSTISFSFADIFKRTFEYNRDQNWLTFQEKLADQPLKIPTTIELTSYRNLRYRNDFKNFWDRALKERLRPEGVGQKTGKIAIDLPLRIQSETFRRVFGGDKVGLRISGHLGANGSLRRESRSQKAITLDQQQITNFKLKQVQQFTLEGKVGEKLSIFVDQDSERPFDFENVIRIIYAGDEDEIVQRVEAGNVQLTLPATKFVSFGQKNTGLFGIKADMKLGPLDLTTIASLQRGQKQKLTLTGSATANHFQLRDTDYIRNQYFFLDDFYRQQFYPLQNINGRKQVHVYNSQRAITDTIRVYRTTIDPKDISIQGWAVVNTDPIAVAVDTLNPSPDRALNDRFVELVEFKDFFVDRKLGYIRISSPLNDQQILAVAYKDSSGNISGDIRYRSKPKPRIILKMLKTKGNNNPRAPTWNLEFKNVYSLGGGNIQEDGFGLKISYLFPGQPAIEGDGTAENFKSFMNLLGIDIQNNQAGTDKPGGDGKVDKNINLINYETGELIFPNLRPFDPAANTSNLPANYFNRGMYDTTGTILGDASRFRLDIDSKNRTNKFQLGINVLQNSEEVTLNGRKLVRDTDYTIDYLLGEMVILDPAVQNPASDLDVRFERGELFQLDKKTLLGSRAVYKFWDDSFVGATILYLNQQSLDQKVQVGREPMSNLIWDLNTQLKFTPEWLTTGVNALPFIRTVAPSTAIFEGEFAQVLPNPNTQNNAATGDNNGVAYIDDFEGSKKTTSLPIRRTAWTRASSPADRPLAKVSRPDRFPADTTRGRFSWYNPYDKVPIKEIWPDRDVNSRTGVLTDVLHLHLEKRPTDKFSDGSAWGGVMRYNSSAANQIETKFIEVWLLGTKGRLDLDFGYISEDANGNGVLDTEDKNFNGILDQGEDGGIFNGLSSDSSYNYNSEDEWSYSPGTGDYSHINGTRNNKDDETLGRPDTEDLNKNLNLDRQNGYFHISLALDSAGTDKKYLAGGRKPLGGWYLYRIPLGDFQAMGTNPDWGSVYYSRIVLAGVTGAARTNDVEIAQLEFVSNEWRAEGIRSDTSNTYIKDEKKFSVNVVNNEDNVDYKNNPTPGVAGVVDRITQAVSKEQSLELRVDSLAYRQEVVAKKNFYQVQNYVNYYKLKMFVYGVDSTNYNLFDSDPDPERSSWVDFFIRFGLDENNYYEYAEPLYKEWDPRNNVEIDLREIAKFKLQNLGAPGVIKETSLPGGKHYRFKGNPSLSQVKFFFVGVKNLNSTKPFKGKIWINELRASDVDKSSGTAVRARTDIAFADVARTNLEVTKTTADFHTINDRLGSGMNRSNLAYAQLVNFEKIFPAKWGLTFPVTYTYNNSVDIPKFFPNSDARINVNSAPDSIKSITQVQTVSFIFQKQATSKAWWMNYTLEKLRFGYNYAKNHSSSLTTAFQNSYSHGTSINYDLPINLKPIKPLGWLGGGQRVKKLSDFDFFYLPNSIGLEVTGTETGISNLNRRSNIPVNSYSFITTRKFSVGWKILNSLQNTWTRAYTSDASKIKNKIDFFKGNFGSERDIGQTFNSSFTPVIFPFLNHSFTYSSAFRWQKNVQDNLQSTSNNNAISGTFNLQLQKMIDAIFGGGKSTPPKPAATSKVEGIDLIKIVTSVYRNLDPIALTYRQNNAAANFGLQGKPSGAYQWGFSQNPKARLTTGSTAPVSWTTNEVYNLSTGLKVSTNITSSYRYEYSRNIRRVGIRDGDFTSNQFLLLKKRFAFPSWNFRVTGIEKLFFFSSIANVISLDHSYEGKKKTTWRNQQSSTQTVEYSSNFQPLIGMNFNWKLGITSSLRYFKTDLQADNFTTGSIRTSKTSTNGFQFQTDYQSAGGFRIPIPIWPFKNKVYQGTLNATLVANISHSVSYRPPLNSTENKLEEAESSSKWSIRQQTNYTFSTIITGGLFFEKGATKSKSIGTISYWEFGVQMDMALRD